MSVRVTPSMLANLAKQKSLGVSVRPFSRSTNVVYKRKKPRKYRKKVVVAKSFRQAFNKLAPSKEIRYEISPDLDTLTSVATRTSGVYLDTIVQGTQLNQRLQSNIHISYVHIHGTLQSNSTVKAKALRMMVFREVNNGGVNPATYANLWKGPGSSTTYAPTGTSSDIRWPLNRQLVQPIYDKTHVIKPEHDGITKLFYKIRLNKIVRYEVNDGTDGTPYHGRLLCVFALADCDDTPVGTTAKLSCGFRVFFKDYHKAR